MKKTEFLIEAEWQAVEGDYENPADFRIIAREAGLPEAAKEWGLSEEIGFFEANIFTGKNGLELVTKDFEVESFYRRRSAGYKVGTRLFQGAIALASDMDVLLTSALVTSPDALRVRRKLFGEAMVFQDPTQPNAVKLPMTVDQAIDSIEYERKRNKFRETAGAGINVTSYLRGINTSGWERPRVLNQPPAALLHALGEDDISIPATIFPRAE